MQVIKLKVKDSIYEKLIGLLGKFNKDEVEIIHDDKEGKNASVKKKVEYFIKNNSFDLNELE